MKALNNDAQMRTDWFIPLVPSAERLRNQSELKLHPTQKPEALLHRVLLASTSPSDIVLNPFLSTGTTAVVRKLSRHFIGIEQHPAYAEAAIDRIRRTIPTPKESVTGVSPKREVPRVPFGSLVESSLISQRTKLHDRMRRVSALVTADGTIVAGSVRESIHKVGAAVECAIM